MAKITFRAKPETVYNVDMTVAYNRIKVPKIQRSHCDMPAFRKHPKFGPYANSDLFANLLKRGMGHIGEYIRLDRALPQGVTVEAGFLHCITIDI